MTNDTLGFVAEALLALCEKDRTSPHYSEDVLHQKLKLANKREPLFGSIASRLGNDVLLQSECKSVLESANLTTRQSEVIGLRLDGWTFEDIGRAGGCTKQGAQRVFVQALKKLTRTFEKYPFAGLSEVYREETRRGLRLNGVGRIVAGTDASRGPFCDGLL